MGRNMVALDSRGTTAAPTTGQIEIIRTLATDVTFADVVLSRVSYGIDEDMGASYVKELCRSSPLTTSIPLALKGVISATLLSCWLRWSCCRRGGLSCF